MVCLRQGQKGKNFKSITTGCTWKSSLTFDVLVKFTVSFLLNCTGFTWKASSNISTRSATALHSASFSADLPATHLPLFTLNMTRAAYYLAQQTWWSLWCDRSSRPAPPAPGAAVSSSAGPCPPPRSPPPRPALSCPGPLRVVHSASRWAEPPAPAYSVSGSWWPLVARPAGTAAREACRAGGGASGARGGATHSWDSPAPLL